MARSIVLLALIFFGMIARRVRDQDTSKKVFMTSTSKCEAGQKNEKEIVSGWQGVVNGTSITF